MQRGGTPGSQVAQALLPVHGVSNTRAKSDRPPSARFTPGNLSGRGNSYRSDTSYFNANRGSSNYGNSRFSGANFTNTSFTRSGSGSFGGSFGSERGRFGQRGGSGYGRYGHNGYGYGHFGHGDGRYGGGWYGGGYGGGWYGGGDDLWILGDLFGLALNFGRFALEPWSYLGGALLDTSVQALSSFDNYDQQASYNPPLCGNYYSDENPGCLQ